MDSKEIWKDIINYHPPSLIIGFLLGMAICYYIIDVSDNCMPQGVCLYQTAGHNVTGNCKDFIDIANNMNRFGESVEFSDPPINLTDFGKGVLAPENGGFTLQRCPNVTCPQMTCSEIPTCPTCGACPDLSIPNETAQRMKNLCKETIKPNGNPAISQGCFKAQYAALDILGLKRLSQFYEGSSPNSGSFYDIAAVVGNYSANTFCFTKDDAHQYGRTGVGFLLNASMWRWNNTINYWDVVNTTKINDTNYNTYVSTESNISDNLWIQRR
jgi:hypothetical protein